MARNIDSCFDMFDQVKQVALLDEPCRTVVDPHQSNQKRRDFLDSPPPNFTAAMEKLEDLIDEHDDIEGTLDAFLKRGQ